MIIGINGKIGVGKDLVGSIVQYLTSESGNSNSSRHRSYEEFLSKGGGSNLRNFDQHYVSDWEVKKFAGKLKTIASLLTGVDVKDFEDQEFKKQYMPEEWNSFISVNFPEMTSEEIKNSDSILVETTYKRMTYREFLQKLGTEAMRDGLHTNVWVNALFSDYVPIVKEWDEFGNDTLVEYPNWIITDMRFPNEIEAVVEKGGITIRVVRNQIRTGNLILEHPSETALDGHTMHYDIINDGTIEDLIEKVKEILIKENII